jgi:calcineurin-like phosphoesterase family protein
MVPWSPLSVEEILKGSYFWAVVLSADFDCVSSVRSRRNPIKIRHFIMSKIWIVSDTHFSQESIIHFKQPDGVTPMRPFANAREMDEALVTYWNETVQPQDHVYHLGDVSMKRHAIKFIGRCNGHKRLLTGNHDIYDTKKDYLPFFEKVYGTRLIDDLLFSHFPIDARSIKPKWFNVHGHLHNNAPMFGYQGHLSHKHLNVSMEWTDYRPIALEEVKRLCQQMTDQYWKDASKYAPVG